MNPTSTFDHDFLKKMNILSLIRDEGVQKAMRLYPELKWYIDDIKNKNYELAKSELLRENQMDLVEH